MKVVVSVYSVNLCSWMWGGRNFNVVIISMGIIVLLVMFCRKCMISSRLRLWMKGMYIVNKVYVLIIYSLNWCIERVMVNYVENGMVIILFVL